MQRRSVRAVALLACVALGLGAAGLGAEIVARAAAQRPTRPPPPRPPGAAAAFSLDDWLLPNRRVEHLGIVYQTNRWGFRGPEREHAPPPGTFRIVIVGDSVVAGAGVTSEETYASRLEAELVRFDSTRRYEVLNLGVPGYNLRMIADRLDGRGLDMQPDLVIYAWTANDIEGLAYRTFPEAVAQRSQEDVWWWRLNRSPSSLVRALAPRGLSLRRALWPRPGEYLYELQYNYLENPGAWSDFVGALDRVAAAVASRGICGHVFVQASLFELTVVHPLTSIYRRVATAAMERELSASQSLAYFRGQDPDALHVVPRADPHPNATAHRMLASALADGLRELPARCWRMADRRNLGADEAAR